MNIPVITAYIKRRNRRKLFAMMRGYRLLRACNKLPRIMDTQIALVEMPLGISNSKVSKYLFGAATEKANEVIRDFLITRVGEHSLNKSLLVSLGKKKGQIVHPLPKIWRGKIRSLGWNVSEIKSAMMWQGFLFLCFGYGVCLFATKILQGFLSYSLSKQEMKGRHVYFNRLTAKELPTGDKSESHDLISWYMQWIGREKKLDWIGHSVKDVQAREVQGVRLQFMERMPPLRGIMPNLRFLFWGGWASLFCLFEWLKGRWWHPLMFSSFVEAYLVRNRETLAVDHMFHNSGPTRPLWTYEAENRGSCSTLYFYSTNCDSFKTKEGYQATPAYYRNMNWSRYLVWDQEQAEFVRRCVGNQAKTEIVGPIWYGESSAILPDLTCRTVAVFDILPRRKSVCEVLGVALEYYTPAIGIKFVNDIHEVVVQNDWIMAWKGKRKLPQTSQIAKSYESVCEKLVASPNMLVIDPDIAATRLIERSGLVISMPFTSTALIARNLGKPSYYYDPSGIIQKNDRAAHGIPVISGVDELQEIFMSKATKPPNDFSLKSFREK